jgi:hypothetical protein
MLHCLNIDAVILLWEFCRNNLVGTPSIASNAQNNNELGLEGAAALARALEKMAGMQSLDLVSEVGSLGLIKAVESSGLRYTAVWYAADIRDLSCAAMEASQAIANSLQVKSSTYVQQSRYSVFRAQNVLVLSGGSTSINAINQFACSLFQQYNVRICSMKQASLARMHALAQAVSALPASVCANPAGSTSERCSYRWGVIGNRRSQNLFRHLGTGKAAPGGLTRRYISCHAIMKVGPA